MTSNGCASLALWNERDPILKERLFGLTNSEANHGEDVKEYYFYLDSTPTHSLHEYLYKYPQRAYPYRDLIETNRRRSREEFEYELLDTGVFGDDRYFDVFVEYAKEARKTSSFASPCTIAGLKRPGFVSCRPSGSATPGRGARISRSRRFGVGPGAIQATTMSLASTGCSAMEPRSCSSPRTK
jgi:hypothetical protein